MVRTGTFGKTDLGSTNRNARHIIEATHFLCPHDCQATSMTVNWRYFVGSPGLTQCAIYEYKGDSDAGSLLGYTESRTVSSEDWYTYNFDNGPILKANTRYFLCVLANADADALSVGADSLANSGFYKSYVFSEDNWPSTITSEIADTWEKCIYCTYDIIEKKDLNIYYSSMTGDNFINCWCSRWDVQNYNVVVETWISGGALQTLQDNIVPGAVGELYTVLGRPRYYDSTWQGKNTLLLSPNDFRNLSNMRNDTVIFVKNITTNAIDGPSNYFNVKIEGLISGSGNL